MTDAEIIADLQEREDAFLRQIREESEPYINQKVAEGKLIRFSPQPEKSIIKRAVKWLKAMGII